MLKSWDINLQQSEKKTLVSFFILYCFFTIILLSILGVIYYNFQKDLMLQKSRQELTLAANSQIAKLKELHVNFDKNRIYPRNPQFESAIYDSAKKEIFSTFINNDIHFDEVIYVQDDKIYLIKEPESYYLGTAYLVVEVQMDDLWLHNVYKTLSIYGIVLLLMMMIVGYFLVRIIFAPMRNAIALLDRFIKDTTHELNTPVNIIMSNIEMIDKSSLDSTLLKKIKRIDIGARTISNLYEDLTYLTLSHKIISHNETVELKELIEERILYFSLLCESKKIEIQATLANNISLHVDRKKITKLIDNLFSNAIKYNTIKGSIEIILEKNFLQIKDNGRGIAKERIDEMFQRYARADSSVGGFGIGLSIVSMIAKEYCLHVEITSVLNEWTKVRVSW